MVQVHIWIRSRYVWILGKYSEWPCLLFEMFEPWEYLCSVNNIEQRESLHELHVLNFDLNMIEYLLHFRCLQFICDGSSVICVYIRSLPLVFVSRPCVHALYLTSHLQNETIWDMNIWNTCEGFTLPFSQGKQVHDLDSILGMRKNLTSRGSARKSPV